MQRKLHGCGIYLHITKAVTKMMLSNKFVPKALITFFAGVAALSTGFEA
jgi:hypothetical protein